ncbi:MAG: hypothetical protein AB7O65_15020 [Candidatus Korobacteraceae bacterium]
MTEANYRESLEAAKSEMEELLTEQGQIDQRLGYIVSRLNVLRKTVLSLSELVGEDAEPQAVGITAAIRKVLRARFEENEDAAYMSPVSVRQALQRDGFPLNEYKNALAVIHTTLKRLEDQDELEAATSPSNKTYYRWKKIADEDIPF